MTHPYTLMIEPAHMFLVAVGGALGGVGRVWIAEAVAKGAGGRLPWGTLAVNVSGAIGLGILAGALGAARFDASASPLWAMLAVGFLGSYTTVSSFSLQTLSLLHAGHTRRAAVNVSLSFGLCLAGAGAGYAGGSALLGG